jgi:hypothetical protein
MKPTTPKSFMKIDVTTQNEAIQYFLFSSKPKEKTSKPAIMAFDCSFINDPINSREIYNNTKVFCVRLNFGR